MSWAKTDLDTVHGEVVEASRGLLGHSTTEQVFVEEHVFGSHKRWRDLQQAN